MSTARSGDRGVTAKGPNHVWHVDLTAVPTGRGFWAPWLPFTLSQCWPFCWWVAVVLDHYSRRVVGITVFREPPDSMSIRAFLARTIRKASAAPRYIICDKGSQVWCDGFKRWCRRRDIRLRFSAVGRHGSIAVIERFIDTLKREGMRRILIPLRGDSFRRELRLFIEWYNQHRPHTALGGCTPEEVYRCLRPKNRQPRIEPRPGWPRRSMCAALQTLVAGRPGARFELDVQFVAGRGHLPVVMPKRVA